MNKLSKFMIVLAFLAGCYGSSAQEANKNTSAENHAAASKTSLEVLFSRHYSNGSKKIEIYPDQQFKTWYESGQLMSEGLLSLDSESGPWMPTRVYFPDGSILMNSAHTYVGDEGQIIYSVLGIGKSENGDDYWSNWKGKRTIAVTRKMNVMAWYPVKISYDLKKTTGNLGEQNPFDIQVVANGKVDENGNFDGTWGYFYEVIKTKRKKKLETDKFELKSPKIVENYNQGMRNGEWRFDWGYMRRYDFLDFKRVVNYSNGKLDGKWSQEEKSGSNENWNNPPTVDKGEYLKGEKNRKWIIDLGDKVTLEWYSNGTKVSTTTKVKE